MSKAVIDDDFLYAHMSRAENLMLERIPTEAELAHTFSGRFNHKMKNLLKYEKRTPFVRSFVHYAKTAAAVFLIFLSISFTTTMSVEAYRVRFFEFVTTVWEELTSIIISSEDNADSDIQNPHAPTYIPNGYSISDQTKDKYEQTVLYTNTAGDEIYFYQKLTTQDDTIIDTESIMLETIEIDGQQIDVVVNKDTTQLYWRDTFSSYFLMGNIG